MMDAMPDTLPIVAGILIGGKSTRMGADKATLPWGDSTIVETIVETVHRVTPECVLLGTCDQLPASLADLCQLLDSHPGIGPITGLHSLLVHHPASWCMLLSCDIPNITREAVNQLVARITPGNRVIVYTTDNRPEPCCALYHADILPNVERAIADKEYSLTKLIARLSPIKVPADDATRSALGNINTRDDYNPSR